MDSARQHPTIGQHQSRNAAVPDTAGLDAAGAGAGGPGVVASAPEGTMRAVMQEEYGSADVLHLGRVRRPVVAADQVLVEVRAAGVDRGTWHVVTGTPYAIRLAMGLRRPRNQVPGMDVAGTVAAVGSKVTRFAVGDEVFGYGRGSFAEYAVASEAKLARKPAELSFEQAAALAVSGSTALQALRDAGRVRAGQQVLVIGASGGVGSYAVQLAAAFGAEVTGVSGTAKLDLVRALGARRAIDYTREDFADGSCRYDLILDIGGNSPLGRLRRALAPAGTAVIVGGEDAGRWTGLGRQFRALALSPFIRQRLVMMFAREGAADLERLAEMAAAGQVVPAIGRTYPLERMPEALRDLEAGKVRGKAVVVP
ncbi:NADPH:quinone reductase [Zafaria cholistanensis]|uniref:NADPH:quinone reductase n=1 Tax=Zafaria cholistanensis TaxID=1682741 RepID=A0A5A7NQE8_9MICC|nr:NAD(P)-dependent alcohol dehydrogenase [Zafaria cholistanensis]GER22776.1 NADPH:quinone reductase [Zafaria cholistanensis]